MRNYPHKKAVMEPMADCMIEMEQMRILHHRMVEKEQKVDCMKMMEQMRILLHKMAGMQEMVDCMIGMEQMADCMMRMGMKVGYRTEMVQMEHYKIDFHHHLHYKKAVSYTHLTLPTICSV